IISAKAGYTSVLSHESSNIEMTAGDQNGVYFNNFFDDFAQPRIVGGVGAFFPDLYLHQDLKAGVWAQIDRRIDSNLIRVDSPVPSGLGGKLDTQYFGLVLSGPLVSSLFYDSFAWLGTGRTLSYIDNTYSYEPIVSFLGSLGLRYYMKDFLYSRISFRFLYASGDDDYTSSFTEGNTEGNATNFIPISKKSMALVFSPQLGNILFTQISYSLKPFSNSGNRALKNIQLELTDINFFRSTTGQISESGINPSSTSLYLGTEIDGTVNFRPFSDLGVSLTGGVFIPANGEDEAFLDSRDVEYLGRLGLSFSF
ncbi:MAG: hypothetical protein KAR21_07175, partial [Spirochaetales bacterium]|nr:hypothetical protein [Spirochaetales bacterium]